MKSEQKCPAFYRYRKGLGFRDVFDNVHEYMNILIHYIVCRYLYCSLYLKIMIKFVFLKWFEFVPFSRQNPIQKIQKAVELLSMSQGAGAPKSMEEATKKRYRF